MRWSACVWLALIGCDASSAHAPDAATPRPTIDETQSPARSGSRLKLRWYLWEDGNLEWERGPYFDSERREWCQIGEWGDGVWRCTPPGEDAVYVTPDCTTVLARAYGESPSQYVQKLHRFGDGSRWSWVDGIFKVGELTADPVATYQLRDGQCTQLPDDPSPWDHFTVVEVPRSDLVTLEHTIDDQGERLSVVNLTSSDGFRIPEALYDRTLDLQCKPRFLFDRVATECVPRNAEDVRGYADSECTQPLMQQFGPRPPGIARTKDTGQCWTYRKPTMSVAPLPMEIYGGPQGACEPLAMSPDERLWLTGSPLELASGALDRSASPERRLQHVSFHGLELPYYYRDAETGFDCARTTPFNGTVACVAISAAAIRPVVLSPDPTCSERITLLEVPSDECADPPTHAYDGGKVYEVLEPYDGLANYQVLFLAAGELCGPAQTLPAGYRRHRAGPPVELPAVSAKAVMIDPE